MRNNRNHLSLILGKQKLSLISLKIKLWDLRNRKMVGELFGHEQTVTSAKIIQNGSFIASCGNDSTVRLWDYKTLSSFSAFCSIVNH